MGNRVMKVRKSLAVAVAAAMGTLYTSSVVALGLGEIKLNSALNQPLQAEIKLLDLQDYDENQIVVRLGSNDDFERAGVTKEYFLNGIKFDVQVDRGTGRVKLKTTDPVVEPYLNFIVEARWPTGRLIREYTVLLDLPVFSQTNSRSFSQSSTPNNVVQRQVRKVAATTTTQPRRATRHYQSSGSLTPGSEYRIKNNDTLWEIAQKAKPSSATVQQTMIGIQQMNPKAFINNNINRIKAGSVLRLPTEQDLRNVSNKKAVNSVKAQTQSIEASTGPQLSSETTNKNVETKTKTESRLSIASSDSTNTVGVDGTADGGAGNVAELQKQIIEAEEQVAESQRLNEELESRLTDMENRMATLQRLVEVKDEQLSSLKSSLEEKQLSAANKVEKAAETTVEKAKETKNTVSRRLKKEESLLDNKPLLIGSGLGATALIGGLLFWRKKKKSEEVASFVNPSVVTKDKPATVDNTVDEVSLGDDFADTEAVNQELSSIEQSISNTEIDELDINPDLATEEFTPEALTETDKVESVEPVKAETDDALGEADIYIAYGRYQQAKDLLEGAIEQEPNNPELRKKLLSVCVETGDKNLFQKHYAALIDQDSSQKAEVLDMVSQSEDLSSWLDVDAGDNSGLAAGLVAGATALGGAAIAKEFLSNDDDSINIDENILEEPELSLDIEEESLADIQTGLDDSFAIEEDVLETELEISDEVEEELQLDDIELDLDGLDSENVASEDIASEDVVSEGLSTEELTVVEDSTEYNITDTSGGLELVEEVSEETTIELDETTIELNEDVADAAPNFDTELDLDGELNLDEFDVEGDIDDLDSELSSLDQELTGELELETESIDHGEVDLEEETEWQARLNTESDDLNVTSVGDVTEDNSGESTEYDITNLGVAGAAAIGAAGLASSLSDGSPESFESTELPEDAPELDIPELSAGDIVESQSDSVDTVAELSPAEEISLDGEDDFDFMSDTDEMATKLDLARAYIDMGDSAGAKEILDEVMDNGTETHKQDASDLLSRLNG